MIRDCRITESRKEPFDETEVEKVFYIIRGKILPYIENNILYGPCDGHNDWPSYGRSNCWRFTRNVYWHIWRENFTNRTGTEDDMMRIYTSLSDRTITHEHCKKYLGTAELGAVIIEYVMKLREMTEWGTINILKYCSGMTKMVLLYMKAQINILKLYILHGMNMCNNMVSISILSI